MTEQSDKPLQERWTAARFERALRGMELELEAAKAEDGEVIGFDVGGRDWSAYFLGGEGGKVDSVWLQAKISDAATTEDVEQCNGEVRFLRVVRLQRTAEAWMDIWLAGLTEEGLVPNIQIWQLHLKKARAFFLNKPIS